MSMKKILVIEDEKLLREEITDILLFEGFEVLQAENGLEGEEMALAIKPDLILCDIMMPEVSGTQLLTRLREHEETKRIPFIFMSALAERKHLRNGMELGADDYITKPFTVQEVLQSIRTRLDKQQVNVLYLEEAIGKVRTEMLSRIDDLQKRAGLMSLSGELDHRTGFEDGSLLEALKSIESNHTLRNLEKLVNSELNKGGLSAEAERAFIKLRNEIRSRNNLVNNWTIFQMKFNQSYPGFVERLVKSYPSLTPQDITLASAITINLNTQQLAGLLNITPASVRKSRYRLKQKFALKEEEHLHAFLHTIHQQD